MVCPLDLKLFSSSIVIPLLLVSACASAPQTPAAPETNPEEVKQLRSTVDTLKSRIDTLESQLKAGQPAQPTAQQTAQQPAQPQAVQVAPPPSSLAGTPVTPHPSEKSGAPVLAKASARDPEKGFINDDAVQNYRRSMILFQSEKWPEAILSFTSFVERYPDHPLAGSAQFYIGEAYLKHHELETAVREFEKVLTSYDRSSHISETLREMARAEEELKKVEDAARHRQILMSSFPQSPAAQSLSQNESRSPEVAPPSVTTPAVTTPATTAPPAQDQPPAASGNSGVDAVPSKRTQEPNPGTAPGAGLDEPPPTAPLRSGSESSPQ